MQAKKRAAKKRSRPARRVRDVMVRKLVTINDVGRLGVARSYMRLSGIRHLLVLREGKLVGVLSERDILGAAANHGVTKAWNTTAAEVMSTQLVTTTPDETLASAAQKLVEARVGCLPVLADGELVAIVTTTDLLRDQAFARPHDPARRGRWI